MSERGLPRLFVRLLRDGYRVRSQAKGASMAPLIRPGDWLTVEPACFAELAVGDIVAYGSADDPDPTLTTHRVMRKNGASYLETRSDSGGWGGRGEPVYPGQILGRVVRIERDGRAVSLDSWAVRLWWGGRVRFRRFLSRVKHLGDAKTPPFEKGRLGGICPTAKSPLAPLFQRGGSVYQKADHVIVKETENGACWLIPVEEGTADMEKVFALNETGAFVWKMLDGGRSVAEILGAVAKEFNVTPEKARADLEALLERLAAMKFIGA